MTNAVDTIVANVLSSQRLTRRVPSFREFCTTVRIYAGPPHLKGTPYRLGSDPTQAYLLEQMDIGRWKRFFWCAPPQFGGKTLVAIIITMLRTIIGARLPVGYGLPTLADLDKAWAEKLKPALRDSGYGDHLPASGPGARGGRGHTLQLSDPESGEAEGLIVFLAGGGYGSTVAAALIDEIDQFRTSAGAPLWGAIEDIFNRSNAYGANALRVGCGTIEDDTRSIILPLVFEQGTGTVAHPQCPHCKAWVRMSFDGLTIDLADEDTAAASARLACPACAALWTEDDRQQALRNCRFPHKGQTITADGHIVGDAPRTQSLGLWMSALESPHANLGDLAREFYRARQALTLRNDHALMRKFWRYRRCEAYTAEQEEQEQQGEISWRFLFDRANACAWGPVRHITDRDAALPGHFYSRHLAEVPTGAVFAAAGTDVQGNRTYWVLVAAALDGTTWDLAWGYEMARLDHQPWEPGELHQMLDRVDLFIASSCGLLTQAPHGLDTGDFTADLLPWQKGHRDRWRATKGQSSTPKFERGDIPGICAVRDGLILIDTDNVRELIHAAYRRPNGAVGAAHIPSGLANNSTATAYPRHLCAERRVRDPKTRKDKIVRGPGRWDWQDARRIAEVMIRLHLQRVRTPPPKRKYGVVGTPFGG